MSNMSYCRFHNTGMDLEDCLCALEEEEMLSKCEFEACEKMFVRFLDFCVEAGIIEQSWETTERLKDFLDTINREE